MKVLISLGYLWLHLNPKHGGVLATRFCATEEEYTLRTMLSFLARLLWLMSNDNNIHVGFGWVSCNVKTVM